MYHPLLVTHLNQFQVASPCNTIAHYPPSGKEGKAAFSLFHKGDCCPVALRSQLVLCGRYSGLDPKTPYWSSPLLTTCLFCSSVEYWLIRPRTQVLNQSLMGLDFTTCKAYLDLRSFLSQRSPSQGTRAWGNVREQCIWRLEITSFCLHKSLHVSYEITGVFF